MALAYSTALRNARFRPATVPYWPTNTPNPPLPKKPASVSASVSAIEANDIAAISAAFDPFHLLDDEELLLLV